WRGLATGRRSLLLLAYLAVAAGLLLKGPIALVLPATVLGVSFLVDGKRPVGKVIHQLGLWWGLPLVVVLALPWFLWANLHTEGEFFLVFFWHHNVERGFDSSGGLREHPWWFYGPQFAFDFLPWTILLPVAVWLVVRRGWWRDCPVARLGVIWLLIIT